MKKGAITQTFSFKIGIVACTAVIMWVLCLIPFLQPPKTYTFSSEYLYSEGQAASISIYEKIALPAGVYKVALEYFTDTDMKSICNVKDGTVFSGGLLSNGEHLYSGAGQTDFCFWLLESTENLQICVEYGGEGILRTGMVTIHDTKQLWTMLMVIILAISIAVIGVIIWKEYDKNGRLTKEHKTVGLVLGMIILITSLPYLQGGIINGADLTYHLQRIEGVKDGLLSGQFPVRLEPEWLYGHGYANGIFYCNSFLLLPALLRLAGFTVMTCYQIYCIFINVLTVCISYYCFKKIFRDKMIGLCCCALYTLSIFRIYKLVITAAVGEGTAVTFMPLIFYGLYRVFTEDVKKKSYKTAWIPIALGYAGLIQTHVLSCEITAFLTILVCIVFCKKILCKETFWELAKGAIAAVVLSIWYLVPFLDYYLHEDLHIKHVSARTIQDRGLYPAQLAFHFWQYGSNAVNGEKGMQYSHAQGIGMVLVFGFIVFVLLWFYGKWKEQDESIVLAGKTSAVFGGMLMLMSLSIFPWDSIQEINQITASLVSSIQFPNRFLGWGTVFLVVVFGCCLWFYKKRSRNWEYYTGLILVLISLTTSSMYLLDYVCRDAVQYRLYNEESMGFGYISGEEYLVEGTDDELLTYSNPIASEEIEIGVYRKDYLHVWLTCSNKTDAVGYVEVPLLHYKGYQAWTEAGNELKTVKGNNNVVRIIIPPSFSGNIEVAFVSPFSWRVSEGISFMVCFGLLMWMAFNLFRKYSQREKKNV